MSIIQVRSVSKAFPGVQALEEVSLAVEPGSCHALMGENGAGKSTLGKLLSGIYQPDSGQILVSGKPVEFRSPTDAAREGIGIVHQELLFCENLSVAENLNLHAPPARMGLYDRRTALQRAKEWLDAVEADIDPEQRVGELTIARQQLVQIAGAIGTGAKILIFDEPTSSLSQRETQRLLECIQDLKAKGVTCLYVSHRLDEVFQICDEVTVLRDGKLVGTYPLKEMDRQRLVHLMVGRDLEAGQEPAPVEQGSPAALKVSGFSSPGRFQEAHLELRQGEIVGLAGLVGAGRTELLQALFGLDPAARGSIELNGRAIAPRSPAQAFAEGLGLIPEDRKRHGLVLGMTARENISLPLLGRIASLGWIRKRTERQLASKFFESLQVRASGIDTRAITLSGGNQQKLVLAKWLASQCKVLLVDEPTRGVDVGAKAEIHTLLRNLAAEGNSILVASSELPELLGLCHRIIVLREGRIMGEVSRAEATEERIMRMMSGFTAA